MSTGEIEIEKYTMTEKVDVRVLLPDGYNSQSYSVKRLS